MKTFFLILLALVSLYLICLQEISSQKDNADTVLKIITNNVKPECLKGN